MPKGVPNLPTDALTAQHFSVEIGGIEIAQFSEFSGGAIEVEVIELKENTPDGLMVINKVPGAIKPPTLTLKRALNSSKDLEDWFKNASDGKIGDARKEGSIVVKDTENAEVARWNFFGAWPSKVSFGTLKAGSNEVLMEECTIQCTRWERVS